MVVEIALIEIVPGQEEAFAAAYAEARHLLAESPGCRSVRMTRGVESPSRFVLLVEWDRLEAHTETFRDSARFVQWRQALGQYFAGPPTVEHYTDVDG